MSSGGSFRIIINDGKSDTILNSTVLLHKQISNEPSVSSIEETHTLFVHRKFKPFVTSGMEYQKVKHTGNLSFGETVKFSIPQYGDFLHDIVTNIKLGKVQSSLQQVPNPSTEKTLFQNGFLQSIPRNGYEWDNKTKYKITTPENANYPDNGNFQLSGQTLAQQFCVYDLVDVFGNSVKSEYRNLVNLYDYPGERLLKRVSISVNGNLLDSYTSEVAAMRRNYMITKDKIEGYKRCVGQETETFGKSEIRYTYDFGATAKNGHDLSLTPTTSSIAQIRNTSDNENAPILDSMHTTTVEQDGIMINKVSNHNILNTESIQHTIPTNGSLNLVQEVSSFVSGLQTPHLCLNESAFWVPLHFWFCKDVGQAFPSLCVPYGQRFIEITLETLENMVVESPYVYVRQAKVVERNSDGNNLKNNKPFYSSHSSIKVYDESSGEYVKSILKLTGKYEVQYSVIPFLKRGTLSGSIQQMLLYINNIFIEPEIHTIYLNKAHTNIIRVTRIHKETIGRETQMKLDQISWPVEFLSIGFQPIWNVESANPNRGKMWHKYTNHLSLNECGFWQSFFSDAHDTPLGRPPLEVGGSVFDSFSSAVFMHKSFNTDNYCVDLPVVLNLLCLNSAIPVLKRTNALFYECVMNRIQKVQSEPGIMTVDFRPATGHKETIDQPVENVAVNPSGHINFSRSREFILKWESNFISDSQLASVTIVAQCLNLLITSNGSMVIRYST